MTKPFSANYLLGRIDAAIKKRRIAQTDLAKIIEKNERTEVGGNFSATPSSMKTLSEITAEIRKNETEEDEKKVEEKSYAFMESQINDKTTAKILKYVTDHMGSPDLKIDDIADAMSMSRSVLYSKIKQSVGMTPIDFVRHIRIMRACELLQQTNDSLTSIAFEVGFSDPKYFSKVFKKEMGIVPSEYRDRTKE